ncbi:LOC100364769 [Phodopus roborovskii]|uniref:LOC100364769 protein n=1 Tax=Phodopus roborovskii TaxID=109678 RepID=A0AAU9ZN20_PHORO|nr:LOC100364769 [Phodopus roborovskii]
MKQDVPLSCAGKNMKRNNRMPNVSGKLSIGAADKRRHLRTGFSRFWVSTAMMGGARSCLDLAAQLGTTIHMERGGSWVHGQPELHSKALFLLYHQRWQMWVPKPQGAKAKPKHIHQNNLISTTKLTWKFFLLTGKILHCTNNAEKNKTPKRFNHRRRLRTDKHQRYGPKHLPGMCTVSSWEGPPGSLTYGAGNLVTSGKKQLDWLFNAWTEVPARRRGTLASAEDRARRVAGVNVPDVRRVSASAAPVKSQVKNSGRWAQFSVLLFSPVAVNPARVDVTRTPTLRPKTSADSSESVYSGASCLAPLNLKILVCKAELGGLSKCLRPGFLRLVFKSAGCFCKGLGLIPNTHMAAHKHLLLQFLGVRYPLLASKDTVNTDVCKIK